MQSHGLSIRIKWDLFKIGPSVFIPGLDQPDLKRQAVAEFGRLNIPVVVRPVIENDIVGIRVWRVP